MQSKPNNWKREEKKFLKPLSTVKEDCEAFGLLVDRVVKFTEAFKYATTSVLLAVVILHYIPRYISLTKQN